MRTKQKFFENVNVIDTGVDGRAIAKSDKATIFVKGAVPGDVIDVRVMRKKKKFFEGEVIKVHQLSDQRTEPVCEHFGTCGGCKWQNMQYEAQLHYKQKQATDSLTRIGKLPLTGLSPIMPSKATYFYRNKLEYTFSNKRWLTYEEINSGEEFERNALGFHIPGMFDKVLDIHQCHLQAEPSNSIRLEVKKYALENGLTFFDLREQNGFLRNLIIRTSTTGEVMTVFSFFHEDKAAREALLNHIAEQFPEITSLMYVINTKKNDTIADLDIEVFKGNDHIFEEMEGLRFRIGPKSFYQTNSEQAYELYKVARNFAGLTGNELVYDLYTGTGTIANFVAKSAKKVVGVEYIEAAIQDAQLNSSINAITNTHFYAGDMKDVLTSDFIKTNGHPDVVITDPPRAGMHEDVVRKIMEAAPEKIVYVSCNPATQARDLQMLSELYEVAKIQPVDMFPQTHHVENVVLMTKGRNALRPNPNNKK